MAPASRTTRPMAISGGARDGGSFPGQSGGESVTASAPSPEPKLRPQLGTFDAVAVGLAAILGAGIFAVIAPAAAIAGPALLISLVIAAGVAFCNALSSAQLAAVFPREGDLPRGLARLSPD